MRKLQLICFCDKMRKNLVCVLIQVGGFTLTYVVFGLNGQVFGKNLPQ